jgi:hypothetical protein
MTRVVLRVQLLPCSCLRQQLMVPNPAGRHSRNVSHCCCPTSGTPLHLSAAAASIAWMRCCSLTQPVNQHVAQVITCTVCLSLCTVHYQSGNSHVPCYAAAASWPSELLSSLLRLAFQNLLQEEDSSVRAASQQLWQRLLQQLLPDALAQALPAHVVQVRTPGRSPGLAAQFRLNENMRHPA